MGIITYFTQVFEDKELDINDDNIFRKEKDYYYLLDLDDRLKIKFVSDRVEYPRFYMICSEEWDRTRIIYIVDFKKNKETYGLIESKTGKVVLECKYYKIGYLDYMGNRKIWLDKDNYFNFNFRDGILDKFINGVYYETK